MRAIGIDSKNFFAEIKTTKNLVAESIKRIIFTRPGERVNNPDFGVGVEQYLFSFIDDIQKTAKENIGKQIMSYEPRIILNDVDLQQQGEKLYIIINYSIRETYLNDENLILVVG